MIAIDSLRELEEERRAARLGTAELVALAEGIRAVARETLRRAQQEIDLAEVAEAARSGASLGPPIAEATRGPRRSSCANGMRPSATGH